MNHPSQSPEEAQAMHVSIQLTNYRGVVQETHLLTVPTLSEAYLATERLARLHSAATGKALFSGNVELLS